jgi:NADH-quinone oxidoreductase subunit N
LLKLFSLAVVAMVFAYSRSFLRQQDIDAGDFYLLGLFALLGILVMISAGSFLAMYLGLETLALALYAMVAVERDAPIGAEAAMKYFVLGAIASGCLLYGISIIYGVSGTIVFSEISTALRSDDMVAQAGVLVGLGFIVVGIAFKFGAVPGCRTCIREHRHAVHCS